jgi:hypothetical protein
LVDRAAPPLRCAGTQDRVLQAIRKSANGIDLPFDTRVVLLHDQTEETDSDLRRQRED